MERQFVFSHRGCSLWLLRIGLRDGFWKFGIRTLEFNNFLTEACNSPIASHPGFLLHIPVHYRDFLLRSQYPSIRLQFLAVYGLNYSEKIFRFISGLLSFQAVVLITCEQNK